MASKRRYRSYQWRLFIPAAVAIWVLLISLLVFQVKRERSIRAEILGTQIELINDRIMAAYDTDTDLQPFLHFIAMYFGDEFYDGIRLSVYNVANGNLIYSVGVPLPMVDLTNAADHGLINDKARLEDASTEGKTDEMFFYSVKNSDDGAIQAVTAMPYNVTIIDALATDIDILLAFFAIAIAGTLMAYFSTRYLGRTIRQLRTFAQHAASNQEFTTWHRFPNDELGEIATLLVNIYNKRILTQNRLECEHRVALKATKEKAELKRSLTNNINHELKTPVGIVKGYIDTIIENPDLPAEQRVNFLKKAQNNIDRLCSMLNSLSTITRLEEAGDTIPTEPIDLQEYMLTLAEEIEESGAAGTMKFTYDLPMECVVMANASLLNGIMLNLVKNAAAYSQGTLMTLKVVNETDRFYTFSFADNGVGVEDRHLPYLFDRFFRVDTGRSRKVGGAGLGLPIVKNSVNTLGGTISANNRRGGGLEFMFTLPKAPDTADLSDGFIEKN